MEYFETYILPMIFFMCVTDTFPPLSLLTYTHQSGILSWGEYAGKPLCSSPTSPSWSGDRDDRPDLVHPCDPLLCQHLWLGTLRWGLCVHLIIGTQFWDMSSAHLINFGIIMSSFEFSQHRALKPGECMVQFLQDPVFNTSLIISYYWVSTWADYYHIILLGENIKLQRALCLLFWNCFVCLQALCFQNALLGNLGQAMAH